MEKFSRSLRGYNPDEVNEFLDRIITKVEKMVKEINSKNEKLKECQNKLDELVLIEQENEELRTKVSEFTRLEESLKRAMLMADKTSEQIKLTAYQERDIIINDAKKNANRIVNEALIKAETIEKNSDTLKRNLVVVKKKLRGILETQLELVDDIEKIDI